MTRLLLVAAAGMDWAGFRARADAGAAPRLAELRARGLAVPLAGAPPGAGPASWACLATGLEPPEHGVWRTTEEWPGGLRPAGRASWKAPPLWVRLEAAGVATGVVAWPACAPGEAWPGLHIDERYAEATGRSRDDWALPLRCMPPHLRDEHRRRRVHPTDITAAMLAPLVPQIAAIDQSRDAGLPMIAIGMARAASIQAAAAWMLAPPPDQTPPQAVFVHQPWIGRLRLFLRGRDDPRFAGVIPAAWRFLDALVGRLADLAGRDTLILVVSPGAEGEPGVLLAAGPGVTPDPELLAARLPDIAPSVLARFGLTDPALPGRRLGAIACEPGRQTLAPAPPEPPARRDPGLVYALRRHGYRPPPRPGRAWRSQGLAELAQMTLERDPRRAGAIAVASLGEDPSNLLALRIRARAHVALDEAEALPALADALTGAAPDRGWGPLARAASHVLKGERRLAEPWLRQAESDPEAGTLLTVAAVWLAAARPANAERVFRRVAEQDPANVSALIGVAMALAARRSFLEAEATLARALARDPTRPAIYLQLADTYARTGRKAEAARAAEAAVRLGAPAPMAVAARSGRLGR